jgi:small-conductance mechanosensitive channel
VEEVNELAVRVADWIAVPLFTVAGAAITVAALLKIAAFLVGAWWVSKAVRLALARMQGQRDVMSPASLYALDRIVHYVLLVLGLFLGLSAIGLDFTTFAVVAGALGIGVGLGLQQLVMNFVSGVILLVERSLKVGDYVELQSGVAGVVRRIGLRATLVTTNDNIDVLIPNAEFVNSRVIDWTLTDDECRIHVPFRVAYGTDKALVRRAALAAAEAVPGGFRAAHRENQVWLTGFGEFSLEFELLVWLGPEQVRRPAAAHAACAWALSDALEAHGIRVPLPQREVRLLDADPGGTPSDGG